VTHAFDTRRAARRSAYRHGSQARRHLTAVVVVALIPGPLYSCLIPVCFPFIQGRIHAKLGQDREPVAAGLLQPD
jgi:hypothetical protein